MLAFPTEGWAVFNLHVEDAGARAMAVCRASFAPDGPGMPALEAAYRDGVMAIFGVPPTPASALFAAACFIFANRLDARP
jgi:hypothetical protein